MINRETTKRLLTAGIVTGVAAIIIGYSLFASYGLLDGPSIVVTDPAYSIATTSSVTIVGVADRVNSLTFDGRDIVIDPHGNFSQTIVLSAGYNIETLAGQDKFGRNTSIQLAFVYEPPE